MTDQVGFTSMAGARAEGDAPEIGIGMLGYAFMGKAHSNAYKKLPYMMYPPVAMPRLVAICGRDEGGVKEAAKRFGYEGYYTDWRKMLENPAVQVFDNGGPNNAHAIPTIAAAEAGKHVFCEKPLARTAEEAYGMLEAVRKAGVQHMVAYNYRFVPAIVQAKRIIESGALGRIFHFRGVYLQEWIIDPNFPKVWRLDKSVAGSGSLGDLGSHVIDLARFLVGEPTQVMGLTKTFVPERPLPDGSGMAKVDIDDAVLSMFEFENGAVGTMEASRFCQGRKNYNCIEINGENGSIQFNLERMNELNVFWAGDDPKETRGFHNALISESYHPYWENWWPHGHMIGWEHAFIHQFHHYFGAVLGKHGVAPYGADFEDGYRNAVICDAIVEAAESKRAVDIKYQA